MKIVHICLACFFPDNYSYQENMLPKFHKRLGYDVEVIASLETFDKNGKPSYLKQGSTYQNEYDIKVTRLNYKKPENIYHKFKRYKDTYETIEVSKPDILFVHGCQFMDMDSVAKYLKRHSNVKVYVDNHADFSNSATNWMSKNILHRIIWRRSAHLIEPYTRKFYGVLPARVQFLKDEYKLPKEKCELLVMGADDELVEKYMNSDSAQRTRDRFGVKPDDFLIVTGGKIDSFKLQTLDLMQAVKQVSDDRVKLIVFGSIQKDIQDKVDALCDGIKVQYIGWAKGEQSYEYFAAADLVVFPGRHSVYWEQVAAQGKPMICKYWDGTTHIDIGRNVVFLQDEGVDCIAKELNRILSNDKAIYKEMLVKAQGNGRQSFLYSQIAKKSIEL